MVSKSLKYGSSSVLVVHCLAKVAMALSETDCHSQTCRPIEQYCSQFEQACMNCSQTCDPNDITYEPSICNRQCSDYIKLQPLKAEIHNIQMQQNVMLVLLVLLLILTVSHFTCKLIKCFNRKRCFGRLMKKLKLKKDLSLSATHGNGKDFAGTTIQNMGAINDIERAPSQIYSLAGAEGSVRTTTTPISSRHPAENTTPSPQPNEYVYDNQGLVVTPVSEKPNGGKMFT